PSLKTTTRCHSVFSLRSPEALSRQLSEVATDRFAIEEPEGICLISGSRPRLPTRITLFTDPAMFVSVFPFRPRPQSRMRDFGPLRFLTQFQCGQARAACTLTRHAKPVQLSSST